MHVASVLHNLHYNCLMLFLLHFVPLFREGEVHLSAFIRIQSLSGCFSVKSHIAPNLLNTSLLRFTSTPFLVHRPHPVFICLLGLISSDISVFDTTHSCGWACICGHVIIHLYISPSCGFITLSFYFMSVWKTAICHLYSCNYYNEHIEKPSRRKKEVI